MNDTGRSEGLLGPHLINLSYFIGGLAKGRGFPEVNRERVVYPDLQSSLLDCMFCALCTVQPTLTLETIPFTKGTYQQL
jgi:hypothetical protein